MTKKGGLVNGVGFPDVSSVTVTAAAVTMTRDPPGPPVPA